MGGVRTIIELLCDLATFIWLMLRPHGALVAENLFLRKQLAMYQERKLKPRRPDTPFRLTLVLLSRLFNWKDALVVVQPQTLVRWHRQGFRLFWRWKSRPGRPPIPIELRHLICEMALSNPSWAKNVLPTNCFSSWRFAYHLVRYESTCPSARGDNRVAINAGPLLFAIMLQPLWPVTSVLS